MHSIIPLLIGWGLDLCTGDPARLPHPIVAFGRWISFFERKANHGNHRRAKGTFWTIATLCTLFLSASRLGHLMGSLPAMGDLGNLFVLSRDGHTYLLLSGRHDARPGSAQGIPSRRRSLEEGRRQVSRIVGRDTSRLSDQEIRTAALETWRKLE